MSWAALVAMAMRWGPRIAGFLAFIPKQVWIGLLVLGAVWYYGSWTADKARFEVRTEIAAQVAAERARVQQADRKAIEAAEARAITAEQLAAARGKELLNVYITAHEMQGAGDICVPGDIADWLRDLS